MNLELAQQLKDAGFPHTRIVRNAIEINDEWFSPGLGELIDACPKEIDDDNTTYYFQVTWLGDKWVAMYDYHESALYLSEGSTPIEAVAKLWLELNKKNDIIKIDTIK